MVLSLFFLGVTFAWLQLDRTPPTWDDAFYLTSSLTMFDALANGGLAAFGGSILRVMTIKPPLIAVLPAPVYLIAGRNPRAAYAVNLVFLLILFAALYRLGSRYASRRAGLLAVYIGGTMPVIYGLARWYLVECGLTALVCVTILLLDEWPRDDGWAPGASHRGSLRPRAPLMKISFPLYVAVPMLFLFASQRTVMCRPKILLAAIAPLVLLTLPWYWFNFRPAIRTAIEAGSSQTAQLYRTGDALSPAAIGRYLYALLDAGPLFYFVILLILLAALAREVRPTAGAGLGLCLLWISPLIFLFFGH